jgi:hypothetical protein
MVTGFTPGPWTAIEFADGGEVVDGDGYEVADLNTGLIAATYAPAPTTAPEAE